MAVGRGRPGPGGDPEQSRVHVELMAVLQMLKGLFAADHGQQIGGVNDQRGLFQQFTAKGVFKTFAQFADAARYGPAFGPPCAEAAVPLPG